MTDKEKIRAEIERRIEELQPCNTRENLRAHGAIAGYYQILSFINSMQEEPISEDLEEACEQLAENARKHKAETSSPFFSQTDYIQGVMDGAKWQKEQMIEKAIKWVEYNNENGGCKFDGWVENIKQAMKDE